MASKILEKPKIELTKIDRLAFDPEKGCFRGALDDLDRWTKLYFEGEAYPWQCYFYHQPHRDKMAVAGIRTGKTHLIGYGFSHMGMLHRGLKSLNVSISSVQAKFAYNKVLEVFSHDRLNHWVSRVERSPYPRIELINGCKMDFRSIGYEGELLCGDQWDFISLDEAASTTSEAAMAGGCGRLILSRPSPARG